MGILFIHDQQEYQEQLIEHMESVMGKQKSRYQSQSEIIGAAEHVLFRKRRKCELTLC